MSSIARRFRVDLERPDPYWPAQLAALAAILLYVTLPNKLTIGPNWLVPVLEVLVLVALVLTTPGDEVPGTRLRQRLAIALIGVLALVNLVALGLLAHYVVEGGAAGRGLVEAAVALWGTIVLVFALVYWELDRGGPVARTQKRREELPLADFRFTQDETQDTVIEVAAGSSQKADWIATFVDYLYLSTTNSSAFSPTDTMPLTSRAKILMAVQATAALITSLLVIARAVGALGGGG